MANPTKSPFRARCTVERLESRALLAATTPVVIDLLAVYTPAAAAMDGGDANIQSLIQASVDTTNLALSNSKIGVSIRLVHAESINYTGSDDLYQDRSRLEIPDDGYMDSVHTLRNQYGADLVTLIVDTQNVAGGNADLITDINAPDNSTRAFSAISWNAVGEPNFTIAHELGHNLGGGHERNNPTQPAVGPFSYSYGYRFTAGSVVYHDIMSYDPGIGIPYYANPAILYHGVPEGSPIGAADEADLASTFAQTSPIVAAYRPTVVLDTTAPRAEIYEISQIAGSWTVNFTVRYSDDSGIDNSTIDSNDVTVSAGGYTLAAGLVGTNHPGLGNAFKLVTYRVTLPETNPPLSSLVFNMRSSAVSDIAGHFVAAGTINPELSGTTFGGFASARDLGTLNLDETRILHEQLSPPFNEDTYQFTLAQPATVSMTATGLSADAQLFMARDQDGDGIYVNNDFIDGSFRAGSADESITLTLPAGTYYPWLYNQATPYTLTLHAYSDTTTPIASLDAADITTAGTTQFIFNVTYADDHEMNADLTRYYTPVRVTNPFGGYYIYFADEIDVDFNAPTRTATYRINVGHPLAAGDNGVYTVAMEPQDSPIWGPPLDNYVADSAGNKLVTPLTLGTFRVAIGQADATPPTASASVSPILIGGGTSWDITVSYRDNVALSDATVDGGDIRVTGPNGFNQLATFVSLSPSPVIGTLRIAVYRITAPGGSWDPLDDGTYTVGLQANQVRDTSNNPAGAVPALATFNVSVPLGGDANRDLRVDIKDLRSMATNFLQSGRGWDSGDFNYDGIVDRADLGILARNWQAVLTPPAPPLPSATGAAHRTAVRVITLVE